MTFGNLKRTDNLIAVGIGHTTDCCNNNCKMNRRMRNLAAVVDRDYREWMCKLVEADVDSLPRRLRRSLGIAAYPRLEMYCCCCCCCCSNRRRRLMEAMRSKFHSKMLNLKEKIK